MKQVIICFFSILVCLLSLTVGAQEVNVAKMDKDQFVFWITANAQIKISTETKKEVYVIRTTRGKPYSGKVRTYEKILWKTLNHGRQIPIGPFFEFADAKRAVKMYELAGHSSLSMEEEISNFNDSTAANEYYWFFLKFSISPRKRIIVLERTAARVAFGDLKDFRQILWEGLSFKQLAIGPFASQFEAEEAKRLYRLEED